MLKQVFLVEQELPTLHLFSRFVLVRSLLLNLLFSMYIVVFFFRPLFVFLFRPLYCLPFDLLLLITHLVTSSHSKKFQIKEYGDIERYL
jgi:hypothetical protein